MGTNGQVFPGKDIHDGTLSLRFSLTLATYKEVTMKGIIAYMLGVPLVVIILLYVFHIF